MSSKNNQYSTNSTGKSVRIFSDYSKGQVVEKKDGLYTYTSSLDLPSGVRVVATTNQTLSGIPSSIDSVSNLADGNLILLTAQTNPVENTIYHIKLGAWELVNRIYGVHTKIDILEGITYGKTTARLDSTIEKIVGTDPFTWKTENAPPLSSGISYTQTITGVGSLTITHSLGKYPSVTVLDSSGTQVWCDITHQNTNTIILNPLQAISGRIICN